MSMPLTTPPRAALYVSCVARGPNLFGQGKSASIRAEVGYGRSTVEASYMDPAIGGGRNSAFDVVERIAGGARVRPFLGYADWLAETTE